MPNNILAIILTWNELEYTLRSITSLISQSVDVFDILVVDNQSDKDPTTIIKNKHPDITVFRNFKNLGVSGGRNIGIQYAIDNNYEYIFFFDNDAYADSRIIDTLFNAAEKYSDTALFGPKIYYDDKKNIIWRAGCTSWKWTYLHAGFEILNRFCRLLQKRPPAWIDTGRGENQKDIGQFDQIRDVDFQIGCAQFIRLNVFKQIGMLDTDFSPYGSEDINFCARLTKHGWKIKYIPDAVCWHRAGGSFTDNYDRSFFNTRNILLLARKNLHPLYFVFLFLPDFVFLTMPLIVIESLMLRQKKRLRGVLDGIKWNLLDIKKRSLLLKNKSKIGVRLKK